MGRSSWLLLRMASNPTTMIADRAMATAAPSSNVWSVAPIFCVTEGSVVVVVYTGMMSCGKGR